MRIWVEQLQSQNAELAPRDTPHKTPSYIQRLRLLYSSKTRRDSIDKLDSEWLRKQAHYHPGDVALKFCTLDSTTPSLKNHS